MSDATKTTGGRRKPAESAASPPPADPAQPASAPPPAEPAQPASSPSPAEPDEPASSQPPAKGASITPPTGGGGGDGKDGNGKGVKRTGDESWRQFWMDIATLIIFLFVALAFVLIIASVFWPYVNPWSKSPDQTLLQQLADTETTRGLITFLVAVSTVSIAVILIVYLASSRAESEDVKNRFAFSKEILTSLIGILGTIIGFYFGASQDQKHGQGTPTTLTLANLSIDPLKLVKGSTVTLNATLSGGQSPYRYVIRFTPDTIKEIPGDSPNGTISQEIKLDAYDPAKPLDITFEGKDARGAINSYRQHLAATTSPSTQIPSTK